MENTDAPPAPSFPLSLFQGYGIELEYMIVDRDTLAVRPICDQLLRQIHGAWDNEVYPDGEAALAAWSNELVLHVVEIKTARPTPTLEDLESLFARQVRRANDILAQWNACLLPGGMHPWMNPEQETRLWPHDGHEVYEAFHRLFDCRRHGWANLQSMHINLPFADDAEFRRLHAAIRAILPLLPALAAASPALDGKCNGVMDNRLEVYRGNCSTIPEITGKVIPEPADGRRDYEQSVLEPAYRALRRADPEGILRREWVNARGAIARFDRGAIEIRLIDVQECPKADLAIARLVCAVVQALAEERFSSFEQQYRLSEEALCDAFLDAVRRGDQAKIRHVPLARCLDISDAATMGEAWRLLADRTLPERDPAREALSIIFQEGCLARRIRRAVGNRADKTAALFDVYQQLRASLADNRLFTASQTRP